jgi:hypothetical protein
MIFQKTVSFAIWPGRPVRGDSRAVELEFEPVAESDS